MKRIRFVTWITTVIITMSWVFSVPAFAIEFSNDTVKTIIISGKAVKVDSKVTAKELELLTPELLGDINLQDGPILSISNTVSQIDETEASVAPMAVIPTNELFLTVVAQRYMTNTEFDYLKFTAIATWKILPTIKLTDYFGIAWSEDFTLYSDSCNVVYALYGGPNTITKSALRKNVAAEAGVGYEFDMVAWSGGSQYQIKKATIEAYTKKHNTTGTLNVVAEYAHEYIALFGGSINMSFSKTPDVGFSADIDVSYNTASPAYDDFVY